MDETEIKAAPVTEATQLREQYESLRHLVVSVLLLLVIVSGTLWVYLLRQVKDTRVQLEGFRPQATNMIAQYEKNIGPAMDNFVKQISEYGRTNSDFTPY